MLFQQQTAESIKQSLTTAITDRSGEPQQKQDATSATRSTSETKSDGPQQQQWTASFKIPEGRTFSTAKFKHF
jgi:hypothetical protein